MYSTCLHCTRDLGTNDVLETLPIGRRVAFDIAQGRLWVVCGSCGKWNLVPFDNRLESIDACERLFRGTPTRFSTDQIGLARVREGLDLVRIGAPQRPEFASWRYGAQYKRRRRKQIAIGVVGGGGSILAASAMEFAGLQAGFLFGIAGLYLPIFGWQAIQTRRRRVLAQLTGNSSAVRLNETAINSVHVSIDRGDLTLALNRGLVSAMRRRVVTVTGPETRILLRRVMGVLNERVGSQRHLSNAIDRVETRNIEGWLGRLDRESVDLLTASQRWRHTFLKHQVPARSPGFAQGLRVAGLPPSDRLAIEMWLSEEDEARALTGELALLERQWREADALAKISDELARADDSGEVLPAAE